MANAPFLEKLQGSKVMEDFLCGGLSLIQGFGISLVFICLPQSSLKGRVKTLSLRFAGGSFIFLHKDV